MSFQDIETGLAPIGRSATTSQPSSAEDSAFQALNSSLSIQIFKINQNVQGILKLVDQLGTSRDSATVRKGLYVTTTRRILYLHALTTPPFVAMT